MFRFLCRLSFKMIMDWKKEMILVMVGIVICSCAVIKFTDNLSSFERNYWDVKGTKEEQVFYENRVHFSYKDSDKVVEVVEQLKNQEGINNVVLKGNMEIVPGARFSVASYSAVPVLSVHDLSIGKMPEKVADGTIVLSYQALVNLERMSSNIGGEDVELLDGEIEKSKFKVFYSCDQQFSIGKKSYDVVAENFDFWENLLSLNDFIELDKTEKLSDLELVYIYDEDFSDRQKMQAANLVQSIKPWESTYEEEIDNTLEISDYLDALGALIIGMIFAVLNALFIYQAVLKRRMPFYSILKLLGVKNFRLGAMILFEMLMVFAVSYSIAVLLFLLYCNITGGLLYNLRYSIGYSFCLLLLAYTVLSVVITRKLTKSQPFEAYNVSR